MHMDLSQETLAGLLRRYGDGPEAALHEVMRRIQPGLADATLRLMRRLRLNRALYDVDEAVNDAVFRLVQALPGRLVRPIESDEEVWGLLRRFSKQAVLDGGRRLAARRRGGDRTGERPALQRVEADLESLSAPSPSPDEVVIWQQQVEWQLGILAAADTSLPGIVDLRMKRYTNNEIASHLGIPLAAVERKFRIARSILGDGASGST
jgi:DNA-directed RNA polymerase specialized sigma24 family protein